MTQPTAALSLPIRVLHAVVAGGLLVFGAFNSVRAEAPDASASTQTVQVSQERILGHWQRGEGEAVIEMRERAGVVRGFIVWSERRPETVGIEVFRELRYDAADEVWKGRAYSIKRKREVPIDIAVPSDNRLELTAYIMRIFTKDVTFTRIPDSKWTDLRSQRGL